MSDRRRPSRPVPLLCAGLRMALAHLGIVSEMSVLGINAVYHAGKAGAGQ